MRRSAALSVLLAACSAPPSADPSNTRIEQASRSDNESLADPAGQSDPWGREPGTGGIGDPDGLDGRPDTADDGYGSFRGLGGDPGTSPALEKLVDFLNAYRAEVLRGGLSYRDYVPEIVGRALGPAAAERWRQMDAAKQFEYKREGNYVEVRVRGSALSMSDLADIATLDSLSLPQKYKTLDPLTFRYEQPSMDGKRTTFAEGAVTFVHDVGVPRLRSEHSDLIKQETSASRGFPRNPAEVLDVVIDLHEGKPVKGGGAPKPGLSRYVGDFKFCGPDAVAIEGPRAGSLVYPTVNARDLVCGDGDRCQLFAAVKPKCRKESTAGFEWRPSYVDHHSPCGSCSFGCTSAPACTSSVLGKTKACRIAGTHDDSQVYECVSKKSRD